MLILHQPNLLLGFLWSTPLSCAPPELWDQTVVDAGLDHLRSEAWENGQGLQMFGEEHPVSEIFGFQREVIESLCYCVMTWLLMTFGEIMGNPVNFRQQKQKVTMGGNGWPWTDNRKFNYVLRRSIPFHKLHILPHQPPLRQVLAKMIQSLSMQELPTFLVVGWHRTIFTMAQQFSSEKDCFDV